MQATQQTIPPDDAVVLSSPQSRFFTSTTKYTCFCGGVGSGKSHALFVKMLADKFAHPKVDLMYGAPTYSLIRDIAYDRIENLLDLCGVPYQLNKAEAILKIEGYGKILFRTLERPERLVGFQVFRAYLDELDTMRATTAEDVWNKMVARCRQMDLDRPTAPNQIFVATTPEGFNFVYNRWQKLIDDSNRYLYNLIKAPTYSNKFLPLDYVDNLRATYPAVLIDAYIEGDFVNLKNKTVYSNFDRRTHHSDAEIEEGDTLYIGMDFNVLNMSAVIHKLVRGQPVAVAEITKGKDTPNMIEIIDERYRCEGQNHHIVVYPDASGRSRKSIDASKSDIQLLRNAGYTVRAKSKNPAVKNRTQSMNAKFLAGNGEITYKVNTDKCPEYTQALEQQVYDKNGMPHKDLADNIDDLCDAGGYYIVYEFPITRREFKTSHVNSY